ncbi:MAG: hypothetical protein HC853_00155 [Anaerolineae bacterium]|nr:hypothetical protein [Anaerolineae bacterium]
MPDKTVDELHADALKLVNVPTREPSASVCHRLAQLYARTIKGQTVHIWVGCPWFYLYVNLTDLIPAGDSDPNAYYIAESLCQ